MDKTFKYTDFMAIWKSARQYSCITSQRWGLSAVVAQSLNLNHTSSISSETKPNTAPLDISEKDTEKFQKLTLPLVYQRIPKKHSTFNLFFHGFNHWMKLPKDKIETFEEIFSVIYNQSIMIDDWLDDSAVRREVPTPQRIYGPKKTLLAYNTQLLLITEKLRELDNPMIPRLFHVAILHFYMGQSQELSWAIDSKCPTMPEYCDLIRLKLQSLCGFIIQAIQSVSECKQDFSTLLKLCSQFYQFQNDYCLLCHEKYWKSKGFGDDISDGKFTLPIIHAVNSGTMEGDIVLNILRQRTKDVDLLKYCISLLEKLGSLEYAKQVVSESEQELRAEIDRLGGNVLLEKMIDNINLWKNDEKFTNDE